MNRGLVREGKVDLKDIEATLAIPVRCRLLFASPTALQFLHTPSLRTSLQLTQPTYSNSETTI